MHPRHFTIVLLIALCTVFASPRAQAQTTGYSASVPVADTSDGQRDHAFSVALGQVLVRTGGQDLTSAPGYTDALGKASSLVQEFHYQRAAANADQPFTLEVKFDGAALRELAGSLGVQVHSADAAATPGMSGGGDSRLWVSNMDSALDLAHVLAALRAEQDVVSVEPVGASGDGVMLDINTNTALSGVLGTLEARGRLQQASGARPGADASVRWLQ